TGFVYASDRSWNVEVSASDLRGHQVDVVVKSDGEKNVSFADACFTLDVDIDAVALDKLYALKSRGATQAASFLVYACDLVSPIEERCYCSRPDPPVSDNDNLHLALRLANDDTADKYKRAVVFWLTHPNLPCIPRLH